MTTKIKGKIKYILSDILTIANGDYFKSVKYLKSIKDIHKGERCFIIGTGPSLTNEDLELLKDEYTFASNRIYNKFSSTAWRPTYYAIFDGSVAEAEGVAENINSIDCEMKFVRQQGYYKSFKSIVAPVCYVKTFHSRKYLDNPKFSTDASKGIYTIGTVTYAMLQLAVHMGFKEIYLIGMDNKYPFSKLRDGTIVENKNVTAYFPEEKNNSKNKVVETWEMDIGYEYAEKFSRENGFRIYNATRGGFLEAFERKNIDSIFNK